MQEVHGNEGITYLNAGRERQVFLQLQTGLVEKYSHTAYLGIGEAEDECGKFLEQQSLLGRYIPEFIVPETPIPVKGEAGYTIKYRQQYVPGMDLYQIATSKPDVLLQVKDKLITFLGAAEQFSIDTVRYIEFLGENAVDIEQRKKRNAAQYLLREKTVFQLCPILASRNIRVTPDGKLKLIDPNTCPVGGVPLVRAMKINSHRMSLRMQQRMLAKPVGTELLTQYTGKFWS